MEKLVIGANFKGAAAGRNQGERFDALAELENLGRQTDGLRRVVSNDAVFDRDLGLHLVLLSEKMVSKRSKTVKKRDGGCSNPPACDNPPRSRQ